MLKRLHYGLIFPPYFSRQPIDNVDFEFYAEEQLSPNRTLQTDHSKRDSSSLGPCNQVLKCLKEQACFGSLQ